MLNIANNSIMFGIDIGYKNYQLSFYTDGMNEAKVIIDENTSSADFKPQAFVFRNEKKSEVQVDFGVVSAEHNDVSPTMVITNIFRDNIENSGLSRANLFAFFIRHCFEILSHQNISGSVKGLCFTARHLDSTLQTSLKDGFYLLDLGECRLYFEDYMESYYHFIIRQKKSAFDDRAVIIYRYADELVMGSMVFRNRLLENTVSNDETVTLPLPIDLSLQEKDDRLSEFINNRIANKRTSSIFIVSKDLSISNMPRSLRALRDRGHIFAGNNLFVMGAAYSAYDRQNIYDEDSKMTALVGSDRIKHDIYIEARRNKRVQNIILAGAEQNFYEVDTCIDVIAYDNDVFEFFVKNIETNSVTKRLIHLTGIPKRPPNTTRLRVKLSFASSTDFIVEVSDLGFGNLFATSGLVFKEVYELE